MEGIIHFPETVNKKIPGIIVLHPHPLYGGSMHNNVVESICEGMVENNMIALRFNCRGVGQSQGDNPTETNGMKDVLSAIKYFNSQVEGLDSENIGFCGYSWGSKVGLEASWEHPAIKYLIGISPPLMMFSFNFLKNSTKPKYLIVGALDQFCTIDKFNRLCKNLSNIDYDVIEGADHFYWGHEKKLKKLVIDFIKKNDYLDINEY
ncbi:MAG: hypothetical protein EAX96_01235 [Candidatus Lokiarchaeota archaeon]|nr:hypothetical protein [Candidatus Lokiarchaeota archaeon]